MQEARAVMTRLDRIEAMELAGEPVSLQLDELGLLLPEAGRWLEREGPGSDANEARAALERFRLALGPDSHRCLRQPDRDRDGGEEHSLVCPCVE